MKHNFWEQLVRVKDANLTDKRWLERTRRHLIAYMRETQPRILPIKIPARLVLWRSFVSFLRPIPALVVLFVFIVGVSASASFALPGDVLYFWKKGVNQRVQYALTISSESKLEFRIRNIDRRLQEIAEVALKPTIAPAVIAKARSDVQSELNQTTQDISKLENEKKDEQALQATVKLKATLETHEKIISTIKASEPATNGELKETAASIAQSAGELKQKSTELSQKTSASIVAGSNAQGNLDAKLTDAENKLQEAIKTVTETQNGNVLTGAAKETIKVAQDALGKAKQASGEGNLVSALQEVQNVVDSTTKASTLADASVRISESLRELLKQVEISPVPSVIVSPVPSGSPNPSSTPSVSSPSPSPQSLSVRVKTNKQTYSPTEPIVIIVSLTNNSAVAQRLTWNTGCQATYRIGDQFDFAAGRTCTQVITENNIESGATNTWEFKHTSTLPLGAHAIISEIIGYGVVGTTINIVQSQQSPTQTPASTSQNVL